MKAPDQSFKAFVARRGEKRESEKLGPPWDSHEAVALHPPNRGIFPVASITEKISPPTLSMASIWPHSRADMSAQICTDHPMIRATALPPKHPLTPLQSPFESNDVKLVQTTTHPSPPAHTMTVSGDPMQLLIGHLRLSYLSSTRPSRQITTFTTKHSSPP